MAEATPNTNAAPAPAAPAAAAPAVDTAALTAAAATAERERISGILNSEEAKANPPLANHFATKTAMSVEDAKAALTAAGPAAPAAEKPKEEPTSPFNAAMSNTDHPNVGADPVAGAGDTADKPSRAAAAMASLGFKTDAKKTGATIN